MNPIKISQQLRQTLVDYLTTTFDVNRDGQEPELATMIRRELSTPGALFNGPFLELAPPYKTARTLNEMITAGVLAPQLKQLPCFARGRPIPLDAPLYTHQDTAITRLVAHQRSIVVSSGTGSGKTESFLIPILNDLLVDETPGVRAILIYPMNALVNDQLDRFRVLLKGTSITFGRYTSELEQSEQEARRKLGREPLPNEVICRDDIQSGERIPQILITNYAMLEYLLLRPEDSKLFQSGLWRFIVLDEAHTYSGAQGVEVAMLIRRLKHRLGKERGAMRCIATSATLTNDEAESAAKFVTALFDEDVKPSDVVFGEVDENFASQVNGEVQVEVDAYLHDEFDNLLQAVRADDVDAAVLYLIDMGFIDDSIATDLQTKATNGANVLWQAMRANQHLRKLRNWMLEKNTPKPARPETAAAQIFGNALQDEDARLHAFYHLVELGAAAREQTDQPPLLPARYHVFVRAPHGMWACVNPDCPGRETSPEAGWSRLFSHRTDRCDACGCHVYPLMVCRECGQVYLRLIENNRQLMPSQDNRASEEGDPRYFTWRPIRENYALGALVEEDEQQEAVPPAKLTQDEVRLCVRCGSSAERCACESSQIVQLWRVMTQEQQRQGKRVLQKEQPLTEMNQCPRCFSKAQKGTEIATPFSVAGTTPLTTITYEMYRHLPDSTDPDIAKKPGNGRKLLTFYDSRQGAARFAAFLQDATNQQNYRHIIPLAARQLQDKNEHVPDLQELANLCTDLALRYGIIQTDPDLAAGLPNTLNLSRAQKKRIREQISALILAEFTTRRTDRQSLETLGLVAVEYFEDQQDVLQQLKPLAEKIGFSSEQMLTLICYLLDDLRQIKVIELPEGVERDNPIFGRNQFSPRLVRGGQVSQNEESWFGKTERKGRRRLVRKMLGALGLPNGDKQVLELMDGILDWLLVKSDLFCGEATDGFQLNSDRLFFNERAQWYRCDTCLRLSARGDSLPCPHLECSGIMKEFDRGDTQNFFVDLFEREIIPLRVEEHTAQLDSVKGRAYQDAFRDGDINILSCSTTFEMGIDLGDLQAVSMSNVPPTVANYRQRSGRAGRRSSGTALILTWASDRPHDQTYFRDPAEIIQGDVRVPHIAIENSFIRARHINAILLSEFLRYRRLTGHENAKTAEAFFDPQTTGEPHFAAVDGWLEAGGQEINDVLARFSKYLGHEPSEGLSREWKDSFIGKLTQINERYQEASRFYLQRIEDAIRSRVPGIDNKAAREQEEQFQKLLNRLRDEPLINYLSARGFLPSYSFPLHTVELHLPPNKATEHLRLQRNLRQAIREYAPGSEVVADKRIWRSAGIQFFQQTPRSQEYEICYNCGHLTISPNPGVPLGNTRGTCEVCQQPGVPRRVQAFLEPDGFRADWKSGQPAKQYVATTWGRERTALLPPSARNEQRLGSSLILYDYQRDGELLYVNEGRAGRGYRICFDCGSVVPESETTCKSAFRGSQCPGSRIEHVALGHVQQTDTLHLRFESKANVPVPSLEDRSFWMSLMYALIHGASRALQIERRDIDGVLYPRPMPNGHWEQTIVLYDDVPGGAGHVKQIIEEFPRVVEQALVILNCTDCDQDTSCTHCLRDYSNQFYWDQLRRREALRYLETISRDLIASETGHVGEVIALNLPYWLMRHIEDTREQLWIAADYIGLVSPLGGSRTWLDVCANLLQRGVAVTMYLKHFEGQHSEPATLSVAEHLRMLIERGLSLAWAAQSPPWQVVIDPANSSNCRAVRPSASTGFGLDERVGLNGLTTTIRHSEVIEARDAFEATEHIPVMSRELRLPASIQVLNIGSDRKQVSEEHLFSAVFSQPVRTLIVNDPYLIDAERIVNRLGAYVRMAQHGGALERVEIYTKRAGQRGMQGEAEEQDRYFARLEKLAGCSIVRVFDPKKIHHDRSIKLIRHDGTKARIIIGRGLNFIRPDGTVDPTYVIIQDPLE